MALEGSIREATCVTLATMYGEVGDEQNEQKLQKKLQKMIDSGLLKKLIPRMVDPLKMVRLHALGALRFVIHLFIFSQRTSRLTCVWRIIATSV